MDYGKEKLAAQGQREKRKARKRLPHEGERKRGEEWVDTYTLHRKYLKSQS